MKYFIKLTLHYSRVLRVQRMFRVFRATRVFRMTRGLAGFTELFRVVAVALPSMGSNASVLFLLVFCYAVLGVNIFGNIVIGGEGFDPYANFSNVLIAMMTLFRIITGEDWNRIMVLLRSSSPVLVLMTI